MGLPDLDNVPKLELASDGEHELEVVFAREFTAEKTSRTCWRVNYRVVDEDTADDFQDLLAFPKEDDDPRTHSKMAQRVREFMESFGLDSGDEADDAKGATGKAIVGVADDDYRGGQKNVIKKYL